jgi:4-diphosphocytidyl-2-C-methyl-D-erythritol kinase
MKEASPTRASVRAPAKVNLHLEVGGRRPDGYHGLISIFQLVSLYDELEIQLSPETGVRLHDQTGFPQEENIVFKAARLFQAAAQWQAGLDITLAKRIPMGAGMGGGSSDAAATLKALNALSGGALAESSVFELAAQLGSDVPFFLSSPCAIVQGRGEIIQPIPAREGLPVILVQPPFQISTKEAFSRLDDSRPTGDLELKTSAEWLQNEYKKPPQEWKFCNSFYEPTKNLFPLLENIRQLCEKHGSSFTTMTGSGSVMVAVFKESGSASMCAARLREGGFAIHEAFLLARNEDVILR